MPSLGRKQFETSRNGVVEIVAARFGVSSGVSWIGSSGREQALRGYLVRSHLAELACVGMRRRIGGWSAEWLKRPLLYH